MLSKKESAILMTLVFIGLVIALKLFHIDYMINYSSESYESFCNINKTFNCDAVAASHYSYFLGVPIALYGSFGNLFLLLFLPFVLRRNRGLASFSKGIYFLIFSVYSLGCLTLMFISFNFISAFCILCMAYWLISFLTLFFLYFLIHKELNLEYFKLLFLEIKKNIVIFLVLIISYLAVNFSVAHLLIKKNCSNPSLKSCQHFDADKNLPYLGETSGFLRVTVFTDFECPYCRKINGYVEKIAEKYKNQIIFVRKEFPLDMACNPLVTRPFHENACLAAYYAKCMGKQGKFWEFHNALYKTTKGFDEDLFKDLADDFNIDVDELMKCVNSNEIKEVVKKEIDEALKLKIEGTPTFKIFGEILEGVITEKDIKYHLKNFPFVDKKLVDNISGNNSNANVMIVDIRDFKKCEKCHIEGSVNIPFDILKEEILKEKSSILSFSGDILFYGEPQDKEKLLEIYKLLENKEINIRLYLLNDKSPS